MNERLEQQFRKFHDDPDIRKAQLARKLSFSLLRWNNEFGDFQVEGDNLGIQAETGEAGNEARSDYTHSSGFRVNFNRRTITGIDGVERRPTNIAYRILLILLENENTVVPRNIIYNEVWGEDYIPDDKTLSVHLAHLRKHIYGDQKPNETGRKSNILYSQVGSNGIILQNPILVPGAGLEPA